MRKWNHYRPHAEAPTDAILEAAGSQKADDRHLTDQDQDLRLEELELGVEPVRAVGRSSRRRLQVAGSGAVATGEAARECRDVGEAAELLRSFEPGAHHPAVELFTSPT